MKSAKRILALLMVAIMAFSACITASAATKATSLKLNAATIRWAPGKSASFKATVTPSSASKTLKWTSSNSKVATVTQAGKLTAKAYGTTTITCATTDGSNLKATCKVTVGKPVTTLKLNCKTINWPAGKSASFKATVTPSDAVNKTLKWTSSNSKVATVSQAGKLTAVAAGTATITCATTDGSNLKATCKVTVTQVKATSLKLNCKTINWPVGKSASFKATVTPENASKTLKWTSSDTKVATVSQSGKLTAVGIGTATITCATTDGSNLKATCKVTVAKIVATSLKLNCKTINWPAGKSASFKATVTPESASKTLKWTSSDTKVATVSQTGKLTAVGGGTAIITCATTDGSNLKATCKVTVTQPKAQLIDFVEEKTTWKIGETGTLEVTVIPSNASKNFEWTSSNPKVATITQSGVLTALSAGTTLITCATTDGSEISVPCNITVRPLLPEATELNLNTGSINLETGESETLNATVAPSDASTTFKWTSSDTKVATVNNGKVTAIGAGTATITCATTDGSNLSAKCTVTVTQPKATNVILNASKVTIEVGGSKTIIAEVEPSNASATVEWTSSDDKIATVSNGKVTAIAEGTATITCKTTDGSNLSATCEVTVAAKPKATKIELSKTSLELKEGKSADITATAIPSNAVQTFEWSSSDTAVATVNNGKVTAVKAGTATITCKTTDGSELTATCEVKVTEPDPEPEVVPMPTTPQEVIAFYNKAVNEVKTSAKSVAQTSEKFSNYKDILDLGSKFMTSMAKPYLTEFFKEYTDRKEYKGSTEIVGAFPVAGQKTSNITADMVSSATCADKGDYYELTIVANCSDSAPEVNPSKGSGKLGKMLNVYDVDDVLALIKASGTDIEIDFSNPKFSYGKGKLVAKIDKKTGKMTALYTDMAAIITAETVSALGFNVKNGKIGIELEHKWEINW